ncbi:MAG: hypothetical protein JO041_02580 [Acidobacteria bacterium]|nr:hypothetical protein [Acidobacteriota bacterium]
MVEPNPAFRKILLASNPAAGPRRRHRGLARSVTDFLTRRGAAVDAITLDSGDFPAGRVADFDAVLICGGDGTINQVLQILVRNGSRVPVGIIPVGSGNLFATSLGVPHHPLKAAAALLDGTPTLASLGTIEPAVESCGANGRRYWMAAAGIGADARVICGVKPGLKARLGMGAYYAEAVRQLCSPALELPWFRAEFTDQQGIRRSELVTQVVAERITYFGRAAERAPAALQNDEMRVLLLKAATRWPYLRFGAALVASQAALPGMAGSRIESVVARSLSCIPLASANGHPAPEVLAEVDGELIGAAPVRLGVQPQAATIIIPAKSRGM